MNIKGKTKDTLGYQYDLDNMGIRHKLHPRFDGINIHMSVASYFM